MRNLTHGAIAALIIGLYAHVSMAQQPAAETFPSAEAASAALYQAVRDANEPALARMLGARNQFDSEDEAQERREREHFARKYGEMHRLASASGGRAILYVGAENWPFPFPLVKEDSAWHFDATAGMKEVLARRIGENELSAIATSRTLLPPTRTLQQQSPTNGQLLVIVGTDESAPFQGYYFRRLPGQKILAYPAEYKVTGVMTFIADENGVHERDLGAGTVKAAKRIRRIDSTATWRRVE